MAQKTGKRSLDLQIDQIWPGAVRKKIHQCIPAGGAIAWNAAHCSTLKIPFRK